MAKKKANKHVPEIALKEHVNGYYNLRFVVGIDKSRVSGFLRKSRGQGTHFLTIDMLNKKIHFHGEVTWEIYSRVGEYIAGERWLPTEEN